MKPPPCHACKADASPPDTRERFVHLSDSQRALTETRLLGGRNMHTRHVFLFNGIPVSWAQLHLGSVIPLGILASAQWMAEIYGIANLKSSRKICRGGSPRLDASGLQLLS